ncbi:MAG: hypothetical protein HC881_22965, partial [Leptolyngbyaceae cyanobacterium SL_7_1]|nr:hypothetical protein [Leptolyngbyaceae cyanobacterium SL_7_1]
MPRSFPLIAVGIGAVITLNPVGATHSQPLTASNSPVQDREGEKNPPIAAIAEQETVPKTDGDFDLTDSSTSEIDSLAQQVALSSPTEPKPSSQVLDESEESIDSKVETVIATPPMEIAVAASSAELSTIELPDISLGESLEFELEQTPADALTEVNPSVGATVTEDAAVPDSTPDSALVLAQRDLDLDEIRAIFEAEPGEGDQDPTVVEREFVHPGDRRSAETSLRRLAQRESLDLDEIQSIYDSESSVADRTFAGIEDRGFNDSRQRRSNDDSFSRVVERELGYSSDRRSIDEPFSSRVEREFDYSSDRHVEDDLFASEVERDFEFADGRRSMEHSRFL